MNCTFLGHSVFLVETESLLLLFDHTAGPIALPSPSKRLLVFVSHRHGDHYDQSVFSFASHPSGASFVLSRDIPASDVPQNVEVIWMEAHETKEIGGVVVKTLLSTDEGVAFLLEVEGTLLYHAGDLNHWHWEGESDAYNREMAKKYRSELALLPSHLDIAFVPVDPRLGDAYSLGARDLVERVSLKTLVPMHFWDDYRVCKRLQSELGTFDTKIICLDESPYTWRIA